jgi:hypothetical protein
MVVAVAVVGLWRAATLLWVFQLWNTPLSLEQKARVQVGVAVLERADGAGPKPRKSLAFLRWGGRTTAFSPLRRRKIFQIKGLLLSHSAVNCDEKKRPRFLSLA